MTIIPILKQVKLLPLNTAHKDSHSAVIRMLRQIEALQDQALAKESQKLAERQARDRARVQRFIDARTRTVGVDKGALDAQLEAKQRLRELEKEAARAEGERLGFGGD